MGKTVTKDLFREIKKTKGRFFSILAIVFLGVAFFAGITASSSDMQNSADTYYDEYNFMDLRILSTVGLSSEDIDAIRSVSGIKGVYATNEMDAVTLVDNVQSVMKVMTVPENTDNDNQDYINRLRIKEGRLPQNSGECVLKYETIRGSLLNIGDTITLESGNDTDISTSLNHNEFKVVGIVYTPYYLSYDMGTSDVGNGTVSYCMFVGNDEFTSPDYTVAYATVQGANMLDTYSDAYFDTVGNVADRINEIGRERISDYINNIDENIAKKRQVYYEKILSQIRKTVHEELYNNYSVMDGIIDISGMFEPVEEEMTNLAIAQFDFSQIDNQLSEFKQKVLDYSQDMKWYVLDRNSHYSYRDYKQCADRMSSIAKVFPVFFIFVAALVCLTTMTRMVDEERELIGTYKALGYGMGPIAFKYLFYAFSASVIGGILGCIVGLIVFPMVIYYSWNILYEMPDIVFANHILLSIFAIMLMTIVTMSAAFASCYSALKSEPSQLMRPKAPKKGKKILLERVKFVWKRLKFSHKVTARNILRYKKRFFMTVIGIAGCTALLTAGFGIKDSIEGLIENQYGKVLRYDVSIAFDNNATQSDKDEVINSLNDDSNFKGIMDVMSYSMETLENEAADGASRDVNVCVAPDSDEFNQYIGLRDRASQKAYEFKNTGIYISEKLAKDMGIAKGDEITVKDKDGVEKKVHVEEVIEMYVGHHIFMSEKYYREVFGKDIINNVVLGDLNDSGTAAESDIGRKYLDMPGISSMSFFSTNIERFTDQIQSLDLVTYVLIAAAAALAFVVLYNLTNVNISERIREIATIKVLGFYDNEVNAYVYRENIIITVIGALAGLLLGKLLHHFIMQTIEMDSIMYGFLIKNWSFVASFALTMLFSIIVNIVMSRKLKKIPMVESLKSVE